MIKQRKGMAIAVVLLFVTCTLAFAGAMFYFRKEVKQQNVINFDFLQANFLAQAAIQHVLLKAHILPQEAYDSGVIMRGFCPLQAVISGTTANAGTQKTPYPMQIFYSDCNTASRPWILSFSGVTPSDYEYRVASMVVIGAFTDTDKLEMIQTIQITAHGTIRNLRGGRGDRTEVMTKTLELKR
ncbi:MAG TPA: hypothetical protein PKO06_17470, partial [Candidatus Ozemobacteraceae bacterium]|nr:hypothetical protein [Candidatus Ozemobacteraceae bacterium]